MNSNIEELESLLFDWESGTLSTADIDRLREILRTDPDARVWFLQHQMLTTALRLEGQSEPPVDRQLEEVSVTQATDHKRSTPAVDTPPGAQRSMNRQRLAIVAVAAMMCVLAGRLVYLDWHDGTSLPDRTADRGKPVAVEATFHGIAMITRLVDVEWRAGQAALDVGDALTAGPLTIDSGYLQIEFFCGAVVVVEGPAELDLKSPTLARVRQGRLRAHVPPAARGFTLEINDMKVVDLGTEFGLSVSTDGADVQVFDGEVELHRATNEKQILTAGQAMGRTAAGEFQRIDIAPESFVDIETLQSHAARQRDVRFQRWQLYSERLRRDPRLITYYTFDRESAWNRRLHSATMPENSELDGAIVGARRVAGRWPAKYALQFKHPGDRVRVRIPGEFGSLTFACWVKIDSLDRWHNSLFLTDGYNFGEPHWQILDTGQLYFSVRPARRGAAGPPDQKILSPPFWKPSLSGRWLHLATTCDIETGETIHFLNGEILHSEVIPEARRVKSTRIGDASIGNWSEPTISTSEFAIRNLNGQIDELAVFNVALPPAEIDAMYQYGRP